MASAGAGNDRLIHDARGHAGIFVLGFLAKQRDPLRLNFPRERPETLAIATENRRAVKPASHEGCCRSGHHARQRIPAASSSPRPYAVVRNFGLGLDLLFGECTDPGKWVKQTNTSSSRDRQARRRALNRIGRQNRRVIGVLPDRFTRRGGEGMPLAGRHRRFAELGVIGAGLGHVAL